MFNIKLTPETLIMLPMAFFLDLCGLGLVIFALDDLGILDLIGIFIFFPWFFIRGERLPSLTETKSGARIKNFLAKLFKNKYLKFLTPLIGEVTKSGARIKEFLTKLFKNKHLKFLTPLIGEVTPWVGGLGFFWTLSVLFNLEEQ